MDILSVFQPPGRRHFSFLSITFGFIANVDIGTEHLRRADDCFALFETGDNTCANEFDTQCRSAYLKAKDRPSEICVFLSPPRNTKGPESGHAWSDWRPTVEKMA